MNSVKYISVVSSFRDLLHNEPSFMTSKETVGPRDHHYLHLELLIVVVLFNLMMDHINVSL